MDFTTQHRFIDEIVPVSYNAVLDCQFSNEENTEPVSLAEAKSWCKISVTDDDTLVTDLIRTERIICEQYTCISFITRTVTATLNNSNGRIYLPYAPVVNVTSITDIEGKVITDYKVYGSGFKFLQYPVTDFVTVVYSAGYETLPNNLKTGLLNQIAWRYENRGDEIIGRSQRGYGDQVGSSLNEGAKSILKPLRRV